jgi:hypothetical protein
VRPRGISDVAEREDLVLPLEERDQHERGAG